MSNYTKSTNFASKDSLPSGSASKIVKGTEINTEFDNIATAVATKLDSSGGAVTSGTIDSTTIGATTPSTGAFTTLSASSTVSGTGFSTYLASPPAIGGTAQAAGSFTTVTASTSVTTPIITSAASTALTLKSAGTTAVTIDTSQNVGIGTTSPSTYAGANGQLVVYGGINTTFANNPSNVTLVNNGTIAAGLGCGINFQMNYNGSIATTYGLISCIRENATSGNAAGVLVFGTRDSGGSVNTEKMRLDSSGNLLVGTTTAPTFTGGATNFGVKGGIGFTGNSASTYYYTIQSNTTDFYIGTTNLSRYAALSGISTFTAWSFGSDRRIKHDIEDVKYGLAEVLAMQPRQYKLNDGNQFSIGFIAQELKEVVPEAVTGEEIEFSDNDTDQERAKKTMGVSKDLLIPVLVKAIQEMKSIIDDQATRIAALEAK
jgi:hypothetical protein